MRWPRKNDAESIRSRREAMSLDGGLVTSVDLEPFAGAAESLVGVAVIPVSAVPVEIELGEYELSDTGDVVETGRADRSRARSARSHRGRAHRVDDPRRARRRRDPHLRPARPDHTRLLLRLPERGRSGRPSRGGSRRSCRACARSSSRATTHHSRSARSSAGSRPMSSDRCATCSGSGRPATPSART